MIDYVNNGWNLVYQHPLATSTDSFCMKLATKTPYAMRCDQPYAMRCDAMRCDQPRAIVESPDEKRAKSEQTHGKKPPSECSAVAVVGVYRHGTRQLGAKDELKPYPKLIS